MLAARGAYRLFADADGATPIQELKRLEAPLVTGADVAFGSRALRDLGVSVTAGRHRKSAGGVFNWLVVRLGLEGLVDWEGRVKAFTGPAAERRLQAAAGEGLGVEA